jgi:hypothetical protein
MSNGKSLAIYTQAQRIKKLELMLETTASELLFMIDKENNRLKSNIASTDESPPDLIDCQTVHEAMEMIKGS